MAIIIIGEIIRNQLHEQGKTVVWLARQLSCSRNNVYRIFHSSSIATHELLRISKVLDYDFFSIYSEDFHEWRTTYYDDCNQSIDM
jgi:plasmid maintenance system antidote protein VapI